MMGGRLCVLAAAVFCPSSHAVPVAGGTEALAPDVSCEATLYQHGGFSGSSKTFDLGFSSAGSMNDDASSMKVVGPSNCFVTVYEHGDGSGWSYSFGPGEYQDVFPNDQVSAVLVELVPCRLYDLTKGQAATRKQHVRVK